MQDAVGIRGSGPGAILRKLTDLVREVSPVDALHRHESAARSGVPLPTSTSR